MSWANFPAARINSISRRVLSTMGITTILVLPALDALALLPRLAQEAAVVSHQQVGLDALHHVQRHADDDEQAGAAEECGDLERNFERVVQRCRHHRDDAEER